MNMVRQIVGTIIEPIAFETNYQRIKLALLHKDKAMTGPTALPHGLTLEEVSYKNPIAPMKSKIQLEALFQVGSRKNVSTSDNTNVFSILIWKPLGYFCASEYTPLSHATGTTILL